MAISSGVGPHAAWLNVNGATFPIEHGSVSQNATRKSSTFSGLIPLSYPGAAETLAGLGDNQATITVMTRGAISTLVTGEVDDTDFDLIGRTISFTGRDNSAKLHDNKTSEKWQNLKPSDIVSQLIGRVGLSGNVTASSLMAGKQVQQDYVRLSDNVSFAYVIHRLAQLDGARWWVDPMGVFNYAPLGSPQGIYSITINQNTSPISADCVELRIKRNIQAGKSVAVTVKSWHPKKKQVFSFTSNVEGNGGPINYNYHVPNLLQDHVTKRAQSRAAEKSRHELKVEATVIGDPSVQAGMGLQLSGTNFFDQTFDIDSVHHDFGMPGHLTHIVARSAMQGRSTS
jgi:phage protein D